MYSLKNPLYSGTCTWSLTFITLHLRYSKTQLRSAGVYHEIHTKTTVKYTFSIITYSNKLGKHDCYYVFTTDDNVSTPELLETASFTFSFLFFLETYTNQYFEYDLYRQPRLYLLEPQLEPLKL